MKKVWSIVLSLVLVLGLVSSLVVTNVSAANYKDSGSLLPDSASDFLCKAQGNSGTEKVTVTKEADGSFKFVGEAGGWPTAQYAELDSATQTSWIMVNKDSDMYLHYDFTAKSTSG